MALRASRPIPDALAAEVGSTTSNVRKDRKPAVLLYAPLRTPRWLESLIVGQRRATNSGRSTPGETGVVKLLVFVEPTKGPFSQKALVTTNDESFPQIVIVACGYSGVEVYLRPSRLHLDELVVGRECTVHCYMKYTGEWEDFQAKVDSAELENATLVRHECVALDDETARAMMLEGFGHSEPLREIGQSVRMLELVFRPTGELSDRVAGRINVHTNIQGYEDFSILVHGEITSPVQAYPSIVRFGEVVRSEDLVQEVMLASRTSEPFRILGVLQTDDSIDLTYNADPIDRQTELVVRTTGTTALQSNGKQIFVHLAVGSTEQEIRLPLTIDAWEKPPALKPP